MVIRIIFTSFYVSASGVYQEKDYQCGTIIVELLDKWSIKEVVMTYGHVQNQFQFERIENLYKPLRKNTKFLQIKQQSDYFIFSNPITFFLTVHDGTHESLFDIQQSTCNDFKLGKASVKLTSGQPIPFLIQESKRDTTSSFSDHIDSAYFTPTYMAQFRLCVGKPSGSIFDLKNLQLRTCESLDIASSPGIAVNTLSRPL